MCTSEEEKKSENKNLVGSEKNEKGRLFDFYFTRPTKKTPKKTICFPIRARATKSASRAPEIFIVPERVPDEGLPKKED